MLCSTYLCVHIKVTKAQVEHNTQDMV